MTLAVAVVVGVAVLGTVVVAAAVGVTPSGVLVPDR